MAVDPSYLEQDQVLTPADWQDAYQVQDAVNLCAVVRSFAEMMSKILDESRARHQGTDWANQHPIAVLFSDKIASLTRTQFDTSRVFDAYDAQRAKSAPQ